MTDALRFRKRSYDGQQIVEHRMPVMCAFTSHAPSAAKAMTVQSAATMMR